LLLGVSMMMAGHLGELALSGVAIATAFCNVTGFSLLWGLCGALETLNGQAYGATQYYKLGSYTYCAIICSLPICLPVCLLWMYMDKLLVLIGQDPQVAEIANRYAMCLIPGLFGYAIVQSQVRFFQSQSLVLPMMFSSLFYSTRISNELGAGNPQAAQIATLVSMLIALVETLIASTILLCCRHVFGYAYSSENDVVIKVTAIKARERMLHGTLAGENESF
nr:unnamed protein product [Gossypium raimondii]